MNAKELNLKAIKLQDEITKAIVDMMKKKGVSLLSFVNNGESSDFDVDRTYTFYDNDGYDIIEETQVVAVQIDDDNELTILLDSYDLTSEIIDMLSEKVIYKDEEDKEIIEKINSNCNFVSVIDTFAPTDTLCQLVYSVEETLNIF